MASLRAFRAAFAARRTWVLRSFFCLLAQNALPRPPVLRVAPGVCEQIAVAQVGVGARQSQFSRGGLPLEGAHHLRPLLHPGTRKALDESGERLAFGRDSLDEPRGMRFGSGQHARAAQKLEAPGRKSVV